MALFNEILVGRLNRWAQKFYAIKSGTASITQLLPTVQTVNTILSGVEDRYLQGWNRFMFTVTQAAVAAQNGVVQLRNPAGSNVVAVIENVNILPGANSLCQVIVLNNPNDQATLIPTTNFRLDRRGNPGSSMIASQGTQAGLSTGASFRALATTTADGTHFINTTNQEITLLPGDACQAILELVNTQVSVALLWRERPLESSELT